MQSSGERACRRTPAFRTANHPFKETISHAHLHSEHCINISQVKPMEAEIRTESLLCYPEEKFFNPNTATFCR